MRLKHFFCNMTTVCDESTKQIRLEEIKYEGNLKTRTAVVSE